MDPFFTLNPHQARSISLAATRNLPPANLRNGSIRRQKQLGYRRANFCLEGITLDRFHGEMKTPQLRWRKLAAWFAIASPRGIRRFISIRAWVVLTIRSPQFPRGRLPAGQRDCATQPKKRIAN